MNSLTRTSAVFISMLALLNAADSDMVLHEGTPVRMRIGRNISSADAQKDETVDFETLDDVKVGDIVIIPRGSTAIATVTDAVPKRTMGRGGKLDVNIDYVRLPNGEKLALRGVQDIKGGGHTGAMTGAMVATAIVFWPAAPLFLFMHGKDISIPKGHEVTVYTNSDYTIASAAVGAAAPKNGVAVSYSGVKQIPEAPKAIAQSPEASSVTSGERPQLVITSAPTGAQIEVNGEFIGNTPSTITAKEGSVTVTVKKQGYQAWQRTLTLNPGDRRTLEAELVKNPNVYRID